ncbi:MAG TPA: hypothetical protein VL625_03740, partial [Patescibacteria group bacterium]|nr:hypothetical protein [Patescibacteria group bacterium]
RDAKYALETTPTIASRLNLAQICMARGDYDEVIAVLEPALTGQFSQDPSLLEGLAFAHFYKRDYKSAMGYIQRIYAHEDVKPKDYVRLLRAQVLEETGDLDGALAELTDLVKFFSGEQARIELAALYEKMRNHEKAQEIYVDIVNRAKRAPSYYREREKEWISVAEQRLSGRS